MKVKTQDYNNITVVELQGDLNGDFTEMLRNIVKDLIANQKGGVVLDMNSVGFIDSQGLEELLWLRDYCYQNNCQLKLAGLDKNCTTILTITNLDNKFDRYPELAEAVKSFA